MIEDQSVQKFKSEADQLKEFSNLNLQDQVHALCLAANKKAGIDSITGWVAHSRGELVTEQVEKINQTYSELKDKITWGDEGNNGLIESNFGISFQSVHKVIADSMMLEFFPDGSK